MASKAARRITPDTAATLTRSFEQLESLLGQPDEYNVKDLEFHDAIHRIAGDRSRSGDRREHPGQGAQFADVYRQADACGDRDDPSRSCPRL